MSMELSLRVASVALVSFMAIVLMAGAARRRIMWRRLARDAEHVESASLAHRFPEGFLVPAGGSRRFDWDLASGGIEFEPRQDAPARRAAAPTVAASRYLRWSRLCHPDDLASLEVALGEHFSGHVERVTCEIRIRDAPDAWRWVLLQGQLADRERAGRDDHVLGVLIDVDGLKRSEQILAGQSRVMASAGVMAFSFVARPPHELVAVSARPAAADRSVAALLEQPLGRALADLIHVDDLAAARSCVEQALLQPGAAAEAELRLAGESAEESWASFRALAFEGSDQALIHGCLIPIDARKRAEALAAEHLAQLRRVVLKTGETQRFLEGLQHMTELLQLSENEADGQDVVSQAGRHLFPGWQGAVTVDDGHAGMAVVSRWGGGAEIDSAVTRGAHSDCWAVRRGRLHHVASQGGGRGSMPACSHFGYGDVLPPGITHTICVPFSAPSDKPGALHLFTCTPVEEDELYATFWRAETLIETLELSLANLHLRVTLREQADRDGMTGLFNRRYFDDVLQREISRAKRGGDRLTLALLDIDRFKSFNDAFGHEAGDEVIRAVAEQLSGFVRSYDVACRIGGEELAVLMSSASLPDACARLDRLREQIGARTLRHQGLELPAITISIGVASLENGRPDDLLRRADLALYASKYGGRNRLSCWTPQLETASLSSESDPRDRSVSERLAE